jgi:hypothetical protein
MVGVVSPEPMMVSMRGRLMRKILWKWRDQLQRRIDRGTGHEGRGLRAQTIQHGLVAIEKSQEQFVAASLWCVRHVLSMQE